MATVSKWTPFGVALDITATGGTVTRTSATQYTVKINVSWETYYSGAITNYGMTATTDGGSATINPFGTYASSGSGTLTGTYSISGNGAATKTITVTFKNFNNDNGDTATKTVSFNVNVPAWTSYKVQYNANGGTGAPTAQTKWKNQTLTLSPTKPTRTGYSFLGWSTSSTATSATYAAGANYTANAAATLYAVWKANTYTITYNANGGTLGSVKTQTKTYGTTLKLTGTATRTNYQLLGWSTSKTATTATYSVGGNYTANTAATLYAVWKLAYTKPAFKSFSVKRCNAGGTPNDEGTCALVSFGWTCKQDVTQILLEWRSADGTITGSKTVTTASGKSGTVSEVIGNSTLTTDATFTITATITDGGGSNNKTASLNSLIFPIEVVYENGKYGIALNKVVELFETLDVNFDALFRKNVYMTESGIIYLQNSDGTKRNCFTLFNGEDSLLVGYGNYTAKDRLTKICGKDIEFLVSSTAKAQAVRPYRRAGDSFSLSLRTSGYVTNSKKDISFWIPMAQSIIGSPTVTITSGTGFTLRQGDTYTHGSSASVSVTPDSYEATATDLNGIYVKAVFSNTTNATNNDSIGIYWNGTITLS